MNYIATKSLKSKGLAAFLVLIFGSFGLFYSSIMGGLVMTLLYPILVIVALFSGHYIIAILLGLMYYIICMIWAISAVNRYNEDVIQKSQTYQENLKYSYLNKPESDYSYYKQDSSSYRWLIVTLVVFLIALLGIHYYNKTDINEGFNINSVFSSHKEDKEAIKNLIEKSYFDLVNGGVTSMGQRNLGQEGQPFYNQSSKTLSIMSLLPISSLLVNEKVHLQIEPKYIKISDFQDENTAKVEYDLSVTTSDSNKTNHISMIAKKVGGQWKLDANKFLGVIK